MRGTTVLLLTAALTMSCGGGVFTVEVGTCFNNESAEGQIPATEEVSSVPEVDCNEPHDNEVFAVIDYTETDAYPGVAAMNEIGTEVCIEQFDEYVGIAYLESELDVVVITPSEGSWNNSNDREIICALYNLDFTQLTGSMAGAAR